ncbi:MAG: hypothetical protein J2P49_10740, partial [Methylocapsa sp.]|nr:hypothetical protein [Methylocapsa sp.]
VRIGRRSQLARRVLVRASDKSAASAAPAARSCPPDRGGLHVFYVIPYPSSQILTFFRAQVAIRDVTPLA